MTNSTIDDLEKIWEQDVLGRRSDATYLQNYLISRYETNPAENGFVLAVNADWGYGKSFMLERWKQDSEFQGHPTIYFDAWKNDFTPDPLLAFISELEEGLTKYFKHIPIGSIQKETALRFLKKVLKPAATIIATTALKHITGHSLESIKNILTDDSPDEEESTGEAVSDAAKEASKKIGDAIKMALEPHKTIKESIKRFKEDLTLLIKHLTTVQEVRLPILIFVDELDRCRPDYAIELLEGIKHLFGVPGVTFVVATNTSQLSESIKAVYGSGFDGQRYLQRFFDLQYTLSRPDNLSFSRLALEKISKSIPDPYFIIYGLENDPAVHTQQSTTIDHIAFVLSVHADAFSLSLRDISQITTILEASFVTLRNERVHIFFLIFLATVYKINAVIFKNIKATKNLPNHDGFNSLLEHGQSNLEISNTDEYGRMNGTKTISLRDVANTYLNNIEKTDFSNWNPRGFPTANIDPSEYKRLNRKSIASFEKYFSVVEQAGGFISKLKAK